MPSTLDFFPQLESQQALEESLEAITFIVGALSILGCLFNIGVTVYFKKSRLIFGKMVILLAVFDLLNNVPAVLITFEFLNSPFTCEVAGSWVTYFGFAGSYFFTTCFAHSLFHSLKNSSIECVQKYYRKYISLSVAAGLVVGTTAVMVRFKEYKSFGNGHSSCTTHQFSGYHPAVLFILVIPGIINMVGCSIYYILTMRVLNKLHQGYNWGLLVYPMIIVICIAPAMLRRLLFLLGIKDMPDIYIQATRAAFGAQGFLNSLAYGLSKEIYGLLKGCCCPRDRSESLMETVSDEQEKDRLYTL